MFSKKYTLNWEDDLDKELHGQRVELDIMATSEEKFSKKNFGADLTDLYTDTALQQIREEMNLIDLEDKTTRTEVLDSLGVTTKDSRYAMGKSTPTAFREAVVEVPTVIWNDVNGLGNVKKELQELDSKDTS